jgi:hypothetical protein
LAADRRAGPPRDETRPVHEIYARGGSGGFLTTNIVSVWDPHKLCFLSENAAPLKINAVIFHDSFGIPWRTFFGDSFERIVFVSEDGEFNPKIIAENHPQVVANEMLERFFNTFDPNELMAKEALP